VVDPPPRIGARAGKLVLEGRNLGLGLLIQCIKLGSGAILPF
jgi:hypothetical protein